MIKDKIYLITVDGKLYTETHNRKAIYFTETGVNKKLDNILKEPYYNKKDVKIETYKKV